MDSEEWLVAEEHDEAAFKRLGEALRAAGGSVREPTWGVAGSQELSTWRVAFPGGSIKVTAETYCGLRLSGPKAIRAGAGALPWHGCPLTIRPSRRRFAARLNSGVRRQWHVPLKRIF